MPDLPSTMVDWTRLIQAEYHEMPGLQLTKLQVRRLWGLDSRTCDVVLATLVDTAGIEKDVARDVCTRR